MRLRFRLAKCNLLEQRAGCVRSVEVWPARSDRQAERLRELIAVLQSVDPDFVTVTYGAMGSSRARSLALIEELVVLGFDVVAHLACLGNSRDELVDLIHRYRSLGVCGVLALRGDPPLESTTGFGASELHHASELVELIRQESDLPVMVALHPDGHPDSTDIASDRNFAAEKLGNADLGLTQFFFDYASFVGLQSDMMARGVTTPIVPGLMVPSSPKQLLRMTEIAGIQPPPYFASADWDLDNGLDRFRALALDGALTLARRALEDGARGVHLFSMNSAQVTAEFFARL